MSARSQMSADRNALAQPLENFRSTSASETPGDRGRLSTAAGRSQVSCYCKRSGTGARIAVLGEEPVSAAPQPMLRDPRVFPGLGAFTRSRNSAPALARVPSFPPAAPSGVGLTGGVFHKRGISSSRGWEPDSRGRSPALPSTPSSWGLAAPPGCLPRHKACDPHRSQWAPSFPQ